MGVRLLVETQLFRQLSKLSQTALQIARLLFGHLYADKGQSLLQITPSLELIGLSQLRMRGEDAEGRALAAGDSPVLPNHKSH